MDYSLREFLKDIVNNKFRVTIGCANITYSEKVKAHCEYESLYEWFNEKYIKEGYGIKSMIKDFKLPISYTGLRRLLLSIGFKLHTPNKANDFLKRRRSINALKQKKERRGIFSEESQNNLKIKNSIQRGIQGYYWNNSKNKYVWLRSSWEFIYAKWLNKNKIEWDAEVKKYVLDSGKIYAPDFFIYEKGVLTQIVEIKGYWKDKLYKYEELKKKLDIDMALITDIKPYLEKNLNEEIRLWKNLRKLELEK